VADALGKENLKEKEKEKEKLAKLAINLKDVELAVVVKEVVVEDMFKTLLIILHLA
jgi:hypothetical protein